MTDSCPENISILFRLESEKQTLAIALEEADVALEQQENQKNRANTAIFQIRKEMEKRIKEKDEEIDDAKKMHQGVIDSLQVSFM